MNNKTFWKAFVATFALATIGLLVLMYPTHPECAKDPVDVGSCSRVDRIVNSAPVLFIVGVPMSLFVGYIAVLMKPTKKDEPMQKGKK